MAILELDETCKDIFQYLLLRNMTGLGPIRYNDLLDNLKDKGLKISRPTLSEHLRHLVEKEVVTRTELFERVFNTHFFVLDCPLQGGPDSGVGQHICGVE